MTWRKRAARAVIFCVAVLGVGATGAGVASADDGAWKAANDTDPHVPITQYQEQKLAEKQQAVAAYFTAVSGRTVTADVDAAPGDAVLSTDSAALAGTPVSASLVANQTPQQTSYWCGPAAVVEALGQMGVYMTQTTAAAKLGTGKDGTAWSGGTTSTRHPVPDVLNLYQHRNYFVPQDVSYSATSGQISDYKSHLVSNIAYIGAPLIGDAWEVGGGKYHLVGHPPDRTIFHWFDIRGYTGGGANTMYEDSVHGAISIGWSTGVPAYSTLSSTAIATIVGGRGYVW